MDSSRSHANRHIGLTDNINNTFRKNNNVEIGEDNLNTVNSLDRRLDTEDKLLLTENNQKSVGSTPKMIIQKEKTNANNIQNFNNALKNSYNNNSNSNLNRYYNNCQKPLEDINEEKNKDKAEADGSEENKTYQSNVDNFFTKANKNSGKIDVQNILIESLRNGQYVYFSLNMLSSINDSSLNMKHIE